MFSANVGGYPTNLLFYMRHLERCRMWAGYPARDTVVADSIARAYDLTVYITERYIVCMAGYWLYCRLLPVFAGIVPRIEA